VELELDHEERPSAGYRKEKSTRHIASMLDAGGDLQINSGGKLRIAGAQSFSGGNSLLYAKEEVELSAVQDYYFSKSKLEFSSNAGLGVSSKSTHRKSFSGTKTQNNGFEAGGRLTIVSEQKDITLKGVKLKSAEKTRLSAKQGKISFLTNTDTEFKQKSSSSSSTTWQGTRGKGKVEDTIQHVEMEYEDLELEAGEGIVVEYKEDTKKVGLEGSLDQLSKKPGLEWMAELKDDPRVEWKGIEARLEQWEYSQQGLSPAAATLVAIAVGAATGGAGAGVVKVALHAGMNALITKASIALINNGGDITAALQELG